jgi:Mg-chelatase subunit ChlD
MRRAVLVAVLVSLAGAAWAQAPVVQFVEPRDGHVVTEPRVVVTGRAERPAGPPAAFDVMVVIDTSGSTNVSAAAGAAAGPTGGIIFGGGPFGLPGGGPSILQAEVAAARRFVDAADRASTRIGVITFSEASGRRPDNAWVEQALTHDHEAVRRALERVGQRTPHGGTDMVAGLRLAIRELAGLEGTQSTPRPDARRVVMFMTDGFPTLPYPSPSVLDPRNVGAALDAARLAARGGVVVHTFCLGREALSAPVVCRDAARLTGGTYQPVQRPADIVDLLPATRIGQVDLVSVRNATTGQMARRLDVDAGGRFSAEVPLAPGPNRLVAQIQGAAPNGGMATTVVHYRPAGQVDIKVEPRPPDAEVDITVERGAPDR